MSTETIMALPDLHTGMPIKMETEGEGIYASTVLSDTTSNDINQDQDQGLTLHPQSVHVFQYDPLNPATEEDFEAVFGPLLLGRRSRSRTPPPGQAEIDSIFRDVSVSPDPPPKRRKTTLTGPAPPAPSLGISTTALPVASNVGQAMVTSIAPAHSPNDSGYGTSIAEPGAHGRTFRESRVIEEIPPQRYHSHDVLASIRDQNQSTPFNLAVERTDEQPITDMRYQTQSSPFNLAGQPMDERSITDMRHQSQSSPFNLAGEPTDERSITDDMFGSNFDSEPRDQTPYYQNAQDGIMSSRGSMDDANATKESSLSRVIPTDPDMPLPSIEETPAPRSIASVLAKGRPERAYRPYAFMNKDPNKVERRGGRRERVRANATNTASSSHELVSQSSGLSMSQMAPPATYHSQAAPPPNPSPRHSQQYGYSFTMPTPYFSPYITTEREHLLMKEVHDLRLRNEQLERENAALRSATTPAESSSSSRTSNKPKSLAGFNISEATKGTVLFSLGKSVQYPWMAPRVEKPAKEFVDLTGEEEGEEEGEEGEEEGLSEEAAAVAAELEAELEKGLEEEWE